MTNNTEIRKGLLRSTRAALRWIAHIALILVVATLKALVAFLAHLRDEIARV